MKKLNLNKKTVSVLESENLSNLKGGAVSLICPSIITITINPDPKTGETCQRCDLGKTNNDCTSHWDCPSKYGC